MKKLHFFLLLTLIGLITHAQRLPLASTSEEYINGSWDSKLITQFEYNTNDQLLSRTIQKWDQANLIWDNFNRYEYMYDAHGNETERIRQVWSHSNQSWENVSRNLTYYYDSVRIAVQEVQSYSGGWQRLSKDSLFYDANNNLELKKTYWWYGGSTQFQYSGREHYYYDSNNRLTSSLYAWISSSPGGWDTISRSLYEHSTPPTDSITLQLYLGNNQWANDGLTVNQYTTSNKLESQEILKYDIGNQQWQRNTLYSHTYHTDDAQNTTLKEVWDGGQNGYVSEQKVTYHYDAVGIAHDNTVNAIRLMVYPNPTQDFITIETQDNHAGLMLMIQALNGQIMFYQPMGSSKSRINIQHLPAGEYIVVLKDNSRITHRRLIKYK